MSSELSSTNTLGAIIRSARAILEKQTFEESARTIFDQCCKLTGATAGYVALLSADGSENEVLFLEAGGRPCSVDPDLPMPIRGLREIAYRTHEAVYENDFAHSEWVHFMPDGHVSMRNVLFSPLNLDGKTVGIMGLANKPGDFTQSDSAIATTFGDIAAIALLNSRYHDQINEKNRSLEQALAEVRKLHGLIPMCSNCKNIRDDSGYWTMVEEYLSEHADVTITHGLCPDCIRKLYPDEAENILSSLGENRESHE